MTHIYFVRHAEPDFSVHDDMTRPLTEKGLRDRLLVSDYLEAENIDVIVSSPFRRAQDTVALLAQQKNLDIIPMDNLRERQVDCSLCF